MRKLLLFIAIILSTANAQTIKQALLYGDKRMEVSDFFGAISYYHVALELDSNSIEVLWKYAEALRGATDYKNAEYYYEKVYQKGGKRLYPESIFHLATVQKYLGKYEESYDSWKIVRKNLGRKSKSYYGKKSRQEMASCLWAKKNDTIIYAKTDSTYLKNLSTLNSGFSDFAQKKYKDGYIFSSMRTPRMNNKLEISDKNYKINLWTCDSNFQDVKKFSSSINQSTSDNGEACLSSDGKRLYFTRCIEGKPCKIYVSKLIAGAFGTPEEVGVINVEGFSSVQPYVCNIGGKEYIFFSSDQEGTEGGLDIWYSEIKNGNEYSKPKNLGVNINSPDDEVSPFYDNLGDKLYFSSTWHNGFGGMDVFYSHLINFNAGKAVNVGMPINSSANDLYYFREQGKRFVTSNRGGAVIDYTHICCNDLYKICQGRGKPKIEEQLYTSLDDLNKYLPVTLYFHNDRPGPNSLDTFTVLSYIETYNHYKELLETYKREYSSGLSSEKRTEAINEMEDFFDHKVDQGVRDLAEFTRLLLIELEKGQRVEMNVQGFASPLAKTDYNVNLTLRRVSSMINYLRGYENGVFIPYINGNAPNGGALTFNKIPFGEYSADQTVSDNPNDKKNSVYSIRAASERKIEIQSVQQAAERDSTYGEFFCEKYIMDLGQLDGDQIIPFQFKFKNVGDDVLLIKDISVENGISVITVNKNLGVGEQGILKFELNPSDLNGHKRLDIILETNGLPKKITLAIVFEKIK